MFDLFFFAGVSVWHGFFKIQTMEEWHKVGIIVVGALLAMRAVRRTLQVAISLAVLGGVGAFVYHRYLSSSGGGGGRRARRDARH